MVDIERVPAPHVGGERELLVAHLQFTRMTLAQKVSGVSEEDARRRFVPSVTSLLGILTHCIDVEKWWFSEFVAGGTPEYRWTDEDPDGDFKPRPDETVDGLIAEYLAECARSDEIIAAADLETVVVRKVSTTGEERTRSVRWVLLHMVEEMARHNGQADILRELVDGSTGV